MKRSNLILNTRIYDTFPKYTYSDDVEKFMDKIVDIVSNYQDTDLEMDFKKGVHYDRNKENFNGT